MKQILELLKYIIFLRIQIQNAMFCQVKALSKLTSQTYRIKVKIISIIKSAKNDSVQYINWVLYEILRVVNFNLQEIY